MHVAGQAGVILHWDGTAWTETDTGTERSVNALWGTSAYDIFAVGDNGSLLHYGPVE